jgi:hypothetical protein
MLPGDSLLLGSIGKKVGLNQQTRFTDALALAQKGQLNGSALVSELDISSALHSLQVYLSVDERNELENWCL